MHTRCIRLHSRVSGELRRIKILRVPQSRGLGERSCRWVSLLVEPVVFLRVLFGFYGVFLGPSY